MAAEMQSAQMVFHQKTYLKMQHEFSEISVEV
jgi:hypothetical protein